MSSGVAIATLVRLGASTRDLSSIYCVRCDFSRLDLRNAKFDDSLLEASSFESAVLDHASFRRADLENAKFDDAHLVGADLSAIELKRPWYQRQHTYSSGDRVGIIYSYDRLTELGGWVNFPTFVCADLRGANFRDRVIGVVVRDEHYAYITLVGANLAGADFMGTSVVVAQQEPGRSRQKRSDPRIFTTTTVDLAEPGDAAGDAVDFIGDTFDYANWQTANLPPLVKEAAKSSSLRPWTPRCGVTPD